MVLYGMYSYSILDLVCRRYSTEATMDTEKLVRYFGSPSTVPVLSIPGRTFPVPSTCTCT